MDIDRLRYFVALTDSETMREAAEHLHISQPALSKAMKLLEHELGEQILVSSGRRVLITNKGKIIADKARQILSELDKITEDQSAANNDYIRIGSFEVFTTYFMGNFATNKLGDFKIQLRELTPGHLEEQLVLGNIDIGITYLPIPKSELEFIKVTEIEMGIFGIEKKFKKANFTDLPFAIPITPIQGAPHKVKGLDGWPDDKLPRNIAYQVELMETALEFCRQGMAVAYLPKFVVEFHNKQVKANYGLSEIYPPMQLKSNRQSVYIVKRKTDIEHPVFRKVAVALRDL